MNHLIKMTPLGWKNSSDPRWPEYHVLLQCRTREDDMCFQKADEAHYHMLAAVHGQPTILPGPDESSKIAAFRMSSETGQKLTALGLQATPVTMRGLSISAQVYPA